MRFVRVFDRKTNEIIRLVVQSDNIIQDQYFTRTFPGATGIKYKEGDSNEFISIPLDANGSFLWEWDLNVLYELIYRDASESVVSSSRSKFWSWFHVAANLFKSDNSIHDNKKSS